jgi:hypothetical protein
MLDRTTAFQIVSMLMAATTHGEIYTSLRHFVVVYTRLTCHLLLLTPEMGALAFQFFIHLPSDQ